MGIRASALDVGDSDDAVGEDLGPILLCRRYLLEAGCDPTIPLLRNSKENGDQCALWMAGCVPVRSLKQRLL